MQPLPLAGPLATVYRTTPAKDRLTVVDVLRNGRPRTFLLNAEADALLATVKLSPRTQRGVRHLPRDTLLEEATLERPPPWGRAGASAEAAGAGAESRVWLLVRQRPCWRTRRVISLTWRDSPASVSTW